MGRTWHGGLLFQSEDYDQIAPMRFSVQVDFRMKTFPIIFALLLPVAAIAQPAPNQAPDRTWITDVTIISPEKIDHIETGSVLIENGRIVRD